MRQALACLSPAYTVWTSTLPHITRTSHFLQSTPNLCMYEYRALFLSVCVWEGGKLIDLVTVWGVHQKKCRCSFPCFWAQARRSNWAP